MTDQEMIEQIRAIASSAFPKDKDDEYNPESVTHVFSRIEALEPAVFDAMTQMLSNDRICRLLVAIGEPAFKYLKYALDNGNRRAQEKVLRILGEIGSPALEVLESILKEPRYEEGIRKAAACHIARNGNIEILDEALAADNEQLRKAAIHGLYILMLQLNPGEQPNASHEPIISIFVRALDDTSASVRWYAFHNLRQISRVTTKMITKGLHDTSEEVRKEALSSLFGIGIDESTAPLLAEAIEDTSAGISSIAIEGITHWGNREKIRPRALADAIINLLVLRNSDLPSQNFSPEQVAQALQQTIDLSPPLREQILTSLCDLAYSHEGSARTRSVRVARRLGIADFSALIQEKSAQNPAAARVILQLLGSYPDTDAIIQQLSEVPPGDVQSIVALQTRLLQEYYENALEQTKTSFKWAIVSTMIGLGCLVVTVVYLLITLFINAKTPDLLGILAGVSSVLSQFIAGGQFWIYDRAGKRLAQSQMQLYQVQRFQLANNVCESLEGEIKHQTRAELVRIVANLDSGPIKLPTTTVESSPASTS